MLQRIVREVRLVATMMLKCARHRILARNPKCGTKVASFCRIPAHRTFLQEKPAKRSAAEPSHSHLGKEAGTKGERKKKHPACRRCMLAGSHNTHYHKKAQAAQELHETGLFHSHDVILDALQNSSENRRDSSSTSSGEDLGNRRRECRRSVATAY